MRISFVATNPCHLYPFARELSGLGALGSYYSGYPAWKLPHSDGVPIRAHSLRTSIVYGMLKYLPDWARPEPRSLFLWQDQAFDRWVGRALEPCTFVHAMPGQCLATFRRARELGVRTVLNHATGPVRDWVRIMEPEYRRIGLDVARVSPYDEDYFSREESEYAFADFHCAASSVVRQQLVAAGISPDRIWVVGYGADPEIFHSRGRELPARFRITFCGAIGLRKGLRTLLAALALAERPDWEMHFYGTVLPEAKTDLASYHGATPLTFHGAVTQQELADAFRCSSVLVLPSLEEGFGLVVPQALSCGLPTIVSDHVGGKDLVRQRENGSIVPVNDPEALCAELHWWENSAPEWVACTLDWRQPARDLLRISKENDS